MIPAGRCAAVAWIWSALLGSSAAEVGEAAAAVALADAAPDDIEEMGAEAEEADLFAGAGAVGDGIPEGNAATTVATKASARIL